MHGFIGPGTHNLYFTPSLHVKLENQIPNSSEYASSLVLVYLPFVLQGRECLIFLPPALHRRTKACEPGSNAITIFSAGLPKKERILLKGDLGKSCLDQQEGLKALTISDPFLSYCQAKINKRPSK